MPKTIHTAAYAELTNWLMQSRKSKKLSMREVGKKLGVTHSMIGKIETRERRLDVYEYVKLCKCLGIDPKQGIKKLEDRMR